MANLDKIKSYSDVKQREVFTDLDTAFDYFLHINGLFADDSAPDVDYIVYGHEANEKGELVADESKPWPTAEDGTPYNAMVAVLSKQHVVDGKNKQVEEVIVLNPVPSIAQLMATAEGENMVNAVIGKELNHRLVRPLRNTENYESVAGEIPSSIAEFCTSGRESSVSSALAVFNDLFQAITKQLKDKVPAFKAARVTKDHLRKSLENSGFAAHYYPTLEEKGFFAVVAQLFIKLGASKDYDVSIIDTWLATRDSQSFEAEASTDGLDDLDGLLDGLGDGTDEDDSSEE